MKDRNYRVQRNVFPIIDEMLFQATKEVEEDGESISCRAGCDHCCHLLVEVCWEEARELCYWLLEQEPERRQYFWQKILRSAESSRQIFLKRNKTAKFATPFEGDKEIPDKVFDEYFDGGKNPCAFLEDGFCAAYHSRPSPCRLHLVSSDPYLCSPECEDDSDYEVPEEIEKVKEDLEEVLVGVQRDGRWGQLAIMVEAVWHEEDFDSLVAEKEGIAKNGLNPKVVAF